MLRSTLLLLLVVSPARSQATQAAFEVASIKPASQSADTFSLSGNRFTAHARLHDLMTRAFDLPYFQVVAPEWTTSTFFDVAATAALPITNDRLKPMLQSLLVSRFGMKVHHETREFSLEVIIIGKKGHHLQPASGDGPMERVRDGRRVTYRNATVSDLAALLSGGGPTTIDRTGLTGRFDFVLDWGSYVDPNDNSMRAFIQAMRDAIQRDLGLDFETRKLPIDVIVVDRVEKVPTEN
jgi:uncharacterized protein (TIGR03435 family)